ncbi:TPA: hypothetical protein N0F65_001934 [Lagenidium giganteum]|uniref:Uncharacterized protein n=1 Tax=Lagenidium giganteum TaxID=4803 RepID=A0AAV2YXP7_9STRA|nr:TPA: hypothetical protein N0F65_001934 [Lagenidium giganteum]
MPPPGVTDTTCDFGLAGGDCKRTFSSFCQNDYSILQAVYCALGIVAFAMTSYKYVAAVRDLGSYLQRRAFLLSMYCAFTFIARGIDPSGYGHFVPPAAYYFFCDSCTAALYSVFIMSLSFWISIIQRGAAPDEKLSTLKVCEYSSHFIIWAFFIGGDVTYFIAKGFGGINNSVQLGVSAVILALISTAFVIYGFRIVRRLEYIAQMNQAIQANRMSWESDFETGRSDNLMSTSSSVSDVVLGDAPPPKPKFQPSQRIRRMLWLIESVSLIAISAQIYVAVKTHKSSTGGSVGVPELDCANGFHCDKLRVQFKCLHGLQFMAIMVIFWTFRKIRKRDPSEVVGAKNPIQLA